MIRLKWFVPVACVIIYRKSGSNLELEFLLGKRKEKEAEGGKWGLVGGTGAFWEGAENLADFARREVIYDLKIDMDLERLQYFAERVKHSRTSLTLEVYFSYELEADKETEVTGNVKAPDACQWFTIEEITAMQQRGEIAFNNYEIIQLSERVLCGNREDMAGKRARKIKVVFANGCFDIIHPGHIEVLKFAKSLGDKLVIGINSDRSVRALKGKGRPVNGQEVRKAVLEAIRYVDEVVIFDELRPTRLIKELKPDIVVKGGGCEIDEVRQTDKIPPEIEIRISPFADGFSTTELIKKIRKKNLK